LAASIAHQINSPLQGITALLSVMKENRENDPDFSENIRLLEGAFISIRNTVRKLLDLNRPGQEKKRTVNIHEIIKDTIALMSTHLRQIGIKTHLNLHKESIYLTASPQQLEHVLLNLINNAIEAITGENRKTTGPHIGEITINTKREKDLLVIEISDSGPGIPDDALEHLFEVFYTKKRKLGMGIGLSVCKIIIEKQKGTIEVRNTVGSGATFRIFLPLKP
jgi:signal transduction histidine kinase